MDGTRPRRRRDPARRGWYARHRTVRFARRLGFPPAGDAAPGTLACGPAAGLLLDAARYAATAWFLWATLPWRCSVRLCGWRDAG
jgi:hypothetical protein